MNEKNEISNNRIVSSEDLFIIENMIWSFSRLNSFYQCPFSWREKYINCNRGIKNFFSEYGSFIHSILEKYAKEELSLFEISQYYEDNFFDNVTYDAPPNRYVDIKESYYNKGLEYLDNIDLDLSEYEILGVEKDVKFTIAGHEMIGFIDLLLRDKDGNIIVVDHKSASLKFNKNGKICKGDEKHFTEFKRQLYLYSLAVIEEYGIEPKQLWWNMFRDCKWIKIDFDKEEFEEAKKWAEETVKLIEEEETWFPNPDYYFCNYLCDQRECCEYKP